MQSGRKKGRLRIYIGIVVSIVCVVWIARTIESDEILSALQTVDAKWLVLSVFMTSFSYFFRAIRWPLFFGSNPPAFRDSYRCLITGFFMNNVLPARVGELVRAHLGGLATKQSRSVVLATVAGERLADGLAISVLFAVLFSLESMDHPTSKGTAMYTVSLLFAAAGVGTVMVLLLRDRIFGLLDRLAKHMPGHISGYTLTRLRRFVDGLEPMFRPRRAIGIILWSAFIWGYELLLYAIVCRAFHQELTIGQLSLFLAAVNFSSLIPAAPAGAGVIELVATQALQEIGIPRATAFSMVAVQHLTQFVMVGIPGLYFFFFGLGGRIPQDVEESGDENPDDDSDNYSGGAGGPPLSVTKSGSIELASGEDSAARGTSGIADALSDSAAVKARREVPPFQFRAAAAADANQTAELDLSVVVPAYNEEARLPKTLELAHQYLDARGLNYEIVVVDDGSRDGTSAVVKRFEAKAPTIRLLTYPHNRGKGYAVRFGMLNARGRQILFCDADAATPIGEIERLQIAIDDGAHVAIGSRARYSADTDVQAIWYRVLLGRVFNTIVNILILPRISDTQCGFKLFVRPAAMFLFERQRAEGFSFDVEILYLARRARMRVTEVAVNWANVPGSKVNLARDSMLMLKDVFVFRIRGLLGKYGNFDPSEVEGLAFLRSDGAV